jgi:hypothetical protein
MNPRPEQLQRKRKHMRDAKTMQNEIAKAKQAEEEQAKLKAQAWIRDREETLEASLMLHKHATEDIGGFSEVEKQALSSILEKDLGYKVTFNQAYEQITICFQRFGLTRDV